MSNNKNRRPRSNAPTQEVQGDKEVLARSIDSLGLPEETLALLKNNQFNTVYDIAKRTEREMFRVQTFNKKHLVAVKNAIKAVGIDFLPYVPREPAENGGQNEQVAQNNDRQPRTRQGEKRDGNQPDTRRQSSKPQGEKPQNGRPQGDKPQIGRPNDKAQNGNKNNNNNQPRQPQRPPEPKKPKVELPLEEWEKITKNGKWGFSNGLKTVIEPQFDEVFCFKEGVACVDVGEKFGYIDPTGAFVIAPKYECAMSFSEGMAVFFEGEKCGYINKEGDVVISPKYDAATAFENGRAKVKEAGKWQTIDPEGNILWSK